MRLKEVVSEVERKLGESSIKDVKGRKFQLRRMWFIMVLDVAER